MCDFSVVAKGQRDYRVGETLKTTQFGPHTRGFAAPADRQTAVCLREGASLQFANMPQDIRQRLELPATGPVNTVFQQLPEQARGHRDALQFENGRTILINDLPLDLVAVAVPSQAGRRSQTAAAIPQRTSGRVGATVSA